MVVSARKQALTAEQHPLAERLMGLANRVAAVYARDPDQRAELQQVGYEAVCLKLASLPAERWVSVRYVELAVHTAIQRAATCRHQSLDEDVGSEQDTDDTSIDVLAAVEELPELERAVVKSLYGLAGARVEDVAAVARRLSVTRRIVEEAGSRALLQLRVRLAGHSCIADN